MSPFSLEEIAAAIALGIFFAAAMIAVLLTLGQLLRIVIVWAVDRMRARRSPAAGSARLEARSVTDSVARMLATEVSALHTEGGIRLPAPVEKLCDRYDVARAREEYLTRAVSL